MEFIYLMEYILNNIHFFLKERERENGKIVSNIV